MIPILLAVNTTSNAWASELDALEVRFAGEPPGPGDPSERARELGRLAERGKAVAAFFEGRAYDCGAPFGLQDLDLFSPAVVQFGPGDARLDVDDLTRLHTRVEPLLADLKAGRKRIGVGGLASDDSDVDEAIARSRRASVIDALEAIGVPRTSIRHLELALGGCFFGASATPAEARAAVVLAWSEDDVTALRGVWRPPVAGPAVRPELDESWGSPSATSIPGRAVADELGRICRAIRLSDEILVVGDGGIGVADLVTADASTVIARASEDAKPPSWTTETTWLVHTSPRRAEETRLHLLGLLGGTPVPPGGGRWVVEVAEVRRAVPLSAVRVLAESDAGGAAVRMLHDAVVEPIPALGVDGDGLLVPRAAVPYVVTAQRWLEIRTVERPPDVFHRRPRRAVADLEATAQHEAPVGEFELQDREDLGSRRGLLLRELESIQNFKRMTVMALAPVASDGVLRPVPVDRPASDVLAEAELELVALARVYDESGGSIGDLLDFGGRSDLSRCMVNAARYVRRRDSEPPPRADASLRASGVR